MTSSGDRRPSLQVRSPKSHPAVLDHSVPSMAEAACGEERTENTGERKRQQATPPNLDPRGAPRASRDSGRFGTGFAGWLDQAMHAVTDRAGEVGRQVASVRTVPERALLPATAMSEETGADIVYEAWHGLMRTVRGPGRRTSRTPRTRRSPTRPRIRTAARANGTKAGGRRARATRHLRTSATPRTAGAGPPRLPHGMRTTSTGADPSGGRLSGLPFTAHRGGEALSRSSVIDGGRAPATR